MSSKHVLRKPAFVHCGLKHIQGDDKCILSNYYPSEMKCPRKSGRVFHCVEQFLQYEKAPQHNKDLIMACKTPDELKLLELEHERHNVASFTYEASSKWGSIYMALLAKFRNPELKKIILATGNDPIHDCNRWNPFWDQIPHTCRMYARTTKKPNFTGIMNEVRNTLREE